MATIAAHVTRGSIWISASRAVATLGGFVSTVALARLLVPEDFGLVAIATTMLAILASFTNLSLSEALIQHRDPTPEHFHAAWSLNAGRGLLLAILFALAADPATGIYREPRLEPVMYALSVSIFLGGLANPRLIVMRKNLIFWQDFVLEVSQKMTGVVVGVAMAFVLRSYWALVIGALASQIVNLIVSYTLLPFRPALGVKHVRELWSFSVWLTLSQVVNTLNYRFDQLLIGRFLGRHDLGLYTVGDHLAVMPTREATAPLTRTLFPAFAKLSDRAERIPAAFQRAQSAVTAAALPLGVGMALVAEPMVRLVMGEKWLPAVVVIQALAAIFAIQTLGSLAQPLSMAAGATRLLFRRDLQLFAIRIPIIIAGMVFGGLAGVIYARVITGLISILFNMALIRQLIGLTFLAQLRVNWRTFLAVALMSAGVLLLRPLVTFGREPVELAAQLAAEIAAGGAIYVGALAATWLAAGRPSGPESEFVRLAGAVRQRVFRQA